MYVVQVSKSRAHSQKKFISYVLHVLLYTYVCAKCTKLFRRAEYALFMNTSN